MARKNIDLVGAHEIRVLFGGVSRQRAYQLTSRADFPRPVAELAQGKIWLAGDVDAWMAVHRPGSGEPAVAPACEAHPR